MGWESGPPSWSEMERILSGRPGNPVEPYVPQRVRDFPGDGGDSPAWSRKREPYRRADASSAQPAMPYAELHAHSSFSFLDGASNPEEMVEEAHRLGLTALALTDHDGFYGIVRFAQAAKEFGLPTVFGSELSLGHDAARTGTTDPDGPHLLVLARGQLGYSSLSSQIARAHLAGGEKGLLCYDLDDLANAAQDRWLILTGCRKGTVRQALSDGGPEAAARALVELADRFGRANVVVELTHQGYAGDDERIAQLADLARELGFPMIATTGAHFAGPSRRRLASAMAALRARRALPEMDGWLPPAGGAHLRSGDEMAQRFSHLPEAITTAVHLGEQCSFDLALVAPQLPPFDVPSGHSEISWLRQITKDGAARRYGPPETNPTAYAQLDRELAVIEQLGFPGYFLIVHDIVMFCRTHDILCQGRGSAANSAVCYAIGITHVDPVRNKLLFERFLSAERDGPPDIDVDIESDRREEAIQYVYHRYGRAHAAQVANVITYRGRSAVRDMARALDFSIGQADAWSKQIGHWSPVPDDDTSGIPNQVLSLARQIEGYPRHLGIHSGGMVICDRPIAEVCPVEWARMPNRSVLQWDKDDCAAIGLVKFDMLGLGMLSALHYCIDLTREHKGIEVDLAEIDLAEAAVYDMLCRADSVGVFQVESRAQMATLPRLKPRTFYDLVVEVALIRPGPIQGKSVHPYIRRRSGEEPATVEHPLMRKALERTLGVPLFQEQLMQLAIDVAGFSGTESDQLRRAMGSKRSPEKMERLRGRFFEGMAANGITGQIAENIFSKMCAFANFGFPESHSQSFASLVFYSAWFKLHHPAIFCAGLLRAQPMGFYSPQSLVADARRHGVSVHEPDINVSLAHASVQDDGLAVRLGLGQVRTIGPEVADRIVAERDRNGRYESLMDVTRRAELTVAQAEALATAGAFVGFGQTRRETLWSAGAAAAEHASALPGLTVSLPPPSLPGMSALELAAADIWATGISPNHHPTQFLRDGLADLGIIPASGLLAERDGTRVWVAGAVTHRQRPATAKGVTFINLEDETGMVNVLCSKGLWARYKTLAHTANALLVRGQLQNASGAVTIVADQLRPLDLHALKTRSRDFR